MEGEEIMEAYRRRSLVDDRYDNRHGLRLAVKNTFVITRKNLRCSSYSSASNCELSTEMKRAT